MKVMFGEANGFQYLVSYMSKLDGSLSAVRTPEWTQVRVSVPLVELWCGFM